MNEMTQIAGPGARSIAYIIDWHIKFLIAFIVLLLGQLVSGNVTDGVDYTIPLVLFIIYQPAVEIFMQGSSPGKKITNIKIVSQNDNPPSFVQLLIRNILRVVDCLPGVYSIGLITCMKTENARRLGDIMAGTKLVYT